MLNRVKKSTCGQLWKYKKKSAYKPKKGICVTWDFGFGVENLGWMTKDLTIRAICTTTADITVEKDRVSTIKWGQFCAIRRT